MSSLSCRSLRQKNIARRCLEKAVEDEIDEFVQTNGRDVIDHQLAKMAEFDNYLIYDDLHHLLDYDDDAEYDNLVDYDYRDLDDDYGYSYDDLNDDHDIDYDLYDDWTLDDDQDLARYSSFIQLQVGTYYKDANNRTYLCCLIDYTKRLINVHTGLEATVIVELKKVG